MESPVDPSLYPWFTVDLPSTTFEIETSDMGLVSSTAQLEFRSELSSGSYLLPSENNVVFEISFRHKCEAYVLTDFTVPDINWTIDSLLRTTPFTYSSEFESNMDDDDCFVKSYSL